MAVANIPFGGLSNSAHESKTPQGRAWAMQNATVAKGILKGSPRYSLFGQRSSANAGDVCYGLGYGEFSANARQRISISGTPTGGDFTITFSGQTTSAINYNGTAVDVLNALEALSNIAVGDVKVTGGPFPNSPVEVEFVGQYANDSVATMTTTDNFSGGSTPASAVTVLVDGGNHSVYICAIKNNGNSTVTMYKVDASTGTYTSVATGLTASDWHFTQYGGRIFGVNATDGLHFFRIGGMWDDGVSSAKPTAPILPPTFSYDFTGDFIDFSSGFASITQSGLGGSPTVTGTTTGISITNGATPATVQTKITITATYSADQAFEFNDVWNVVVRSSVATEANLSVGSLRFSLTNNDGSPLSISPTFEADPLRDSDIQLLRYFHFANVARKTRDNILKLVITFTVDSWAAAKQVTIQVKKCHVWMPSKMPFSFEVSGSTPVPDPKAKLRYAYSYFNAATGVESDLSPEALTQDLPPNWEGANVTLACRGSSELAVSDRIYVYRKEIASGQWRRLPTGVNTLDTWGAANVTSGNASFTDKWMEDDLTGGNGQWAAFRGPNLPGFIGARSSFGNIAIGVWKNSLVLGAARKLWLSFVGFLDGEVPRFAPDPDDKAAVQEFVADEINNDDRGRTYYLSDNRTEHVYGVLGQDSLYGIGPRSSYASVGDTPAESSVPRRLPGSRGSVSPRGICRFGGGAQVASQDGFWYYSVGRGFSGEDNGALTEREETLEVRRSYIDTLLGDSFSNVVACEYRDESWLFNGAKYLRRTRDGQWEEGTLADSVTAVSTVRANALRFADSRGRMMEFDEDVATDNEAEVTWSYETGVLDGPSTKISDIEIQGFGQPTVTLWIFNIDGQKHYAGFGRYDEFVFDTADGEYQIPFRRPLTGVRPGSRYKLFFSGLAGRDEVHTCAIHFEEAGKQR